MGKGKKPQQPLVIKKPQEKLYENVYLSPLAVKLRDYLISFRNYLNSYGKVDKKGDPQINGSVIVSNNDRLEELEPMVDSSVNNVDIFGDDADDIDDESNTSDSEIDSAIKMDASAPGLTPLAKTITDCYTVFLVKIDEAGYTIRIVYTNVIKDSPNILKLQNLIAVRVCALLEKYQSKRDLRQRPICLYGVIDCQLSNLGYENYHKDLFNFKNLTNKIILEQIKNYIPFTTIPEYAILEFKIPDSGSRDNFTRLLTSFFTKDRVLLTILNQGTPAGHRVLVYNENNIRYHSQPINPKNLLFNDKQNAQFAKEYTEIAEKEVLKNVLRNIRRNLFKVMKCGDFDALVNALGIPANYTSSMSSGEVNSLYCRYIDTSGVACSTGAFRYTAGKTHKKRYNAKKINKSRKQKTNKSKKHTKGRKTRKGRRIR